MNCYGYNNMTANLPTSGSNGSYNDDVIVESKAGRAINFAEKIHMVLSNKECRGKSTSCSAASCVNPPLH